MRKVELSPSILNADRSHIENEIQCIRDIKAKYLHLDVMDGIFVPNINFSPAEVQYFCAISHLINDVHIMVQNPCKLAEIYANCGANIVTFHIEACNASEDIVKIVEVLHQKGCKAGISLKPETPIESIYKYLDLVDLVLVMSVEPGKGGQGYLPESSERIKKLREYIDSHNLNVLIEVDGGINDKTAKFAIDAGVDILVVGSYLFSPGDIRSKAKKLFEK